MTIVTDNVHLDHVGAIALDLDGCLVLSDEPGGPDGHLLPGATAVLRWAAETGCPRVVFTNGSSYPPARIASHLRDMGADIGDHEVITPAVVAARVCRQRWPDRPVMAFGGPGVVDVLAGADVALAGDQDSDVAAVVIAWDTEFGYDKLQRAARAVRAGAQILVTSNATHFATSGECKPGLSGFIAAGLSYVTGRPYEVVGKPSPLAMQVVLDALDRPAEQVLVVGDDLTLELAMARAAGAIAVLVTTGVSSADDTAALPLAERPALVLGGLDELVSLLPGAPVPTDRDCQR